MTDFHTEIFQEVEDKEQFELKERQLKRKAVVDKYKHFIDNLSNKKCIKNPKGMRFRKQLQSALRICAEKVFPTEMEEYNFIGKPYRGIFHHTLEHTGKPNFEDDEMKIIREIMEEFGTWEY